MIEQKILQALCDITDRLDVIVKRQILQHQRTPFDDYRIDVRKSKLAFDTNGKARIGRNDNRQGFIFTNISSDFLYIAFGEDDASATNFTIRLDIGGTEFYLPTNYPYKGEVHLLGVDASGFCMVNEFSFQPIEDRSRG